jgi:uncharacterized protein (TIGR02145 family)
MKKHIPALFLFLALIVSSSLVAQSPQGIPYQAVMRNADGTVMASSEAVLTFMIHDGTANGTVVYQESHSLNSNAQGLVSCVVGNGVVSEGNFSNINWGGGAKFLHVMMGSVDLGTQQMLSVPYALYAENVGVRVSATGDTLVVGGQSVIVPGISAINHTDQSALGSLVLPGIEECNAQLVSINGCGLQDSFLFDGYYYDLVEIGGQCWFKENLRSFHYNDGSVISEVSYPFAGDMYSPDLTLYPAAEGYGHYYSPQAALTGKLCPEGWHLPTHCDWSYLESQYGTPVSFAVTGVELPPAMLDLNGWQGNLTNQTSTGLSILPTGICWPGGNVISGNVEIGYTPIFQSQPSIPLEAHLWLGTSMFYEEQDSSFPNEFPMHAEIFYYEGSDVTNSENGLSRSWYEGYWMSGFIPARCLKNPKDMVQLSVDSVLVGCSDPQACNYVPDAYPFDGAYCAYFSAACDDGNANTSNDVINGSCECAGTVVNNNNVVIGQDYQGGKVAYIFKPVDAGYVAGETHGLIAAAQDLPGTYPWGCVGTAISGAYGQAIGTGAQNTLDIVNAGCGGAAQACADLVLNGYSDWFLPSLIELRKLCDNQTSIGGFQNSFYWSSSQPDSSAAWRFHFNGGIPSDGDKSNASYVRAVRAF